MQENRTKARSATHSPEEVLKKQVEELTARAQLLEQEKNAAEESRNYMQLERVPPTFHPLYTTILVYHQRYFSKEDVRERHS